MMPLPVHAMACAALLLFVFCVPAQAARTALYVAPNGNDRWSGTRPDAAPGADDGPLATLEGARDAIRALRRAGKLARGGVTVHVRGGTYWRSQAFELTAEDSGTAGAPVTYAAYRSERPALIGGKPVNGWKAVTDPAVRARLPDAARDHVLEADLATEGIRDFGTLRRRGFGQSSGIPAALELYFCGSPMRLARWPNDGWSRIAATPDGPEGGAFRVNTDRLSRWIGATDAWVHGYWTYDWADTHERVAAVDAPTATIRTQPPHGIYGYKPGQRWYAYNLLEELDAPGEWYLDRAAGRLYFWAPAAPVHGDAIASMLEEPVVRMTDVSHVRLERIEVAFSRGPGIVVDGGASVAVAGCTVRGVGTTGVSISGARESGAVSCDVFETGDTGISLVGGDRKKLTPGGLYAENCHIYRYSRWDRTYRPAVAIEGVGNRIANCRIHDAPHNAILLSGNNHTIEFNEVYRVCTDTGDAGAFYMGRDFTMRGNVVRHNVFRDIRRTLADGSGFVDVMSVYLDDCASGTLVYGNLFVRGGRAAMIGGGRDNTIENNVFVDCVPAVHIDARGKSWAAQYFVPNGGWSIFEKLADVGHDKPPYSTAYPELANILAEDPPMAKGNRVLRNVSVGGRWLDLLDGLSEATVTIKDNLVGGEPPLRDAARGDYRIKAGSSASRLGIQDLPLQKVGLRIDRYRRSLPPREDPK